MIRDRHTTASSEPMYAQAWSWLKNFPAGLAKGSTKPPTVSGPAAAALISAGIGPVLMMISHHLGDTSKDLEKAIWSFGKWIPGSQTGNKVWGEIGPYAGKETFLLVGWLFSWAILHLLWRKRKIRPRTMLFWLVGLFALATVMAWPPLFPYLPLM